jgi:hypothetical protein
VATFPLGHNARAVHTANAKAVARVEASTTSNGAVRGVQDPVDLRGLPAIGRGVSGAIWNTQPERALDAKENRRRS